MPRGNFYNSAKISGFKGQNVNLSKRIADIENEISLILGQLTTQVKHANTKRLTSETTIGQIDVTYNKICQENKQTSVYHRNKLKSLYGTACKDADYESDAYRACLNLITKIKVLKNEKRALVRKLDCYSANGEEHKPRQPIRRGALMVLLQQGAMALPLWVSSPGQHSPPLCGAKEADRNHVCKPGDMVAAFVKAAETPADSDISNQSHASSDELSENWILAEVVEFNSNNSKYTVDDIDEEQGDRYILPKSKVIPLPIYRANPLTDHEALFNAGDSVLALYPQTTCFYSGIVQKPPSSPMMEYLVQFEDNSYPSGYSPPLPVPQKYVISAK